MIEKLLIQQEKLTDFWQLFGFQINWNSVSIPKFDGTLIYIPEGIRIERVFTAPFVRHMNIYKYFCFDESIVTKSERPKKSYVLSITDTLRIDFSSIKDNHLNVLTPLEGIIMVLYFDFIKKDKIPERIFFDGLFVEKDEDNKILYKDNVIYYEYRLGKHRFDITNKYLVKNKRFLEIKLN